MIQSLFAVVSEPNFSYWDAGSVAVLSGVIAVLWRRNTTLEDRSRADLKQAVEAMALGATAIKDVTKTVERLEERIKESA